MLTLTEAHTLGGTISYTYTQSIRIPTAQTKVTSVAMHVAGIFPPVTATIATANNKQDNSDKLDTTSSQIPNAQNQDFDAIFQNQPETEAQLCRSQAA